MALIIKKAVKYQAKLKACLVGPSGSGKTFTSLTFARALAGPDGKIMVLDSEKGSASLYSDLFDFDVAELWSRDENRRPISEPFSPDKYMEAIAHAEEQGYAVLVIDSLTHVWNDAGGFLEIVNKVARRNYKGNTWAAWNDVDPLYRKFLNTITDARLHVICTMRTKTDSVSEKDETTGKTSIKKLGTKGISRDGLEYEFTLLCQMDLENTLIVEKTRCRMVRGAVVSNPTGAFMEPIIRWLDDGAPVETPRPLPVEESATSDLAEVSAVVGKVFAFAAPAFETRWHAYKQYVLGAPISDSDLSQSDLIRLRTYAEQHEKKLAQAAGQ